MVRTKGLNSFEVFTVNFIEKTTVAAAIAQIAGVKSDVAFVNHWFMLNLNHK